jgi:cell division protein ZapA (FtsZ GTPase activity inhibitor)
MNIEITIEGRTYPFRFDNEEDEMRLRKAAARVEEKLAHCRKYGDRDLQDILVITALHFAAKAGENEVGKNEVKHFGEILVKHIIKFKF